MANFQSVVGSTACPINTVALIIRPSTHISNEWPTLAMELNVGNERIKKFRQDLLLDKITQMEVISELLDLWVAENGSGATLGKLINVVEEPCGANDVGESLRLHFHLPCKAAEGNTSIDWNDISPSFLKLITETFHNFFPTLKFSEFLPNLKGPALIKLMTGKKPPIFVHPFPETLSYYINRTLTTRSVISKKIFEQDSQDIFLFTGLDLSELSALAGQKLTGTSSAQLRYSSTVRFLILDRDHHFDKICEKTNHPVHLLIKEADGRLRWTRSSGGMDNLQKCVNQVQDEFDEEALCRHLGSHTSPVIICDSPGMGKSVLLAQIGATLGRLHPNRIVPFISFSEFIKQIKSIEINDEVKMIEVVLEKLTGEPVHSSSTDERTVIFELLLDGFDELDSGEYKLAHSILKHIATSFKSTRLWVTSRPHLMNELEASLNQLGYNIRPFHQQHQVEFLSSFWSRKEQLDEDRSKLFAENCLKSLKSRMKGSHSQDIAGIPLQCLLIGEVYEDDAVEYALVDNNDAALIVFEIGTITDLYQRLIRKKIEKYKSLNGRFGEDELMGIHAQFGLELIFRDKLEALKLGPIPSDEAELLKFGIIVKSSIESSYAFLHRTFAEYFVAWFVVDKLRREGEWTEGMNGFFLHSVLGCRDTEYYRTTKFSQPVICYFLNSFIADHTAGNNSPHICTQLDGKSAWLVEIIAYACANDDLVHIFKLFHDRYESDESYTSTIFTADFLYHSIRRSSLELVKPVVSQLEKQDRFSMEVQGEALCEAVKFGKFPVVEFLIKEKHAYRIVEELSYVAGGLVNDCIYESVNHSDEEVETRIQVLRMLIRMNGSLLNDKVGGDPPLLFHFVHVKLLIELVRLGADVFAEDTLNCTVLHLTSHQKLSSSDYHILVMSIPDKGLRELVHRKNISGRIPLTSALEWIDPAPETLDVFHRVGADFNHTDSLGSSVLKVAVKNGRSAVTIRKIIQHGDIKLLGHKTFSITRFFRPNRRTNLLHIAAECGNMEAVGVLVDEYRMDLNSKDERGRTPLDRLIKKEYGDRFAIGLALKERGGRFKEDHSLIAAAANHNEQSVRLLISFGVDVNGRNENGDTALHKSVEPSFWYSPHSTIAQLLVHSGADVTALNKMGITPLHTALKNEKLNLQTFMLLKSKTDEAGGWTPDVCELALKFAFRGKDNDRLDEEGFISILNNFSKTNEQNVCLIESDGDFAVHFAARWGHFKTLQLLVEKGADINVKDKLGQTPLHVVARYKPNGYMLMVKYLAGRVDLYAKDNGDRTFLHGFILESPSPSAFHLMVEYLIEAGVLNLFSVSGGSCRKYEYNYNCGAFPLQLAVGYLEPEIKTLELLQRHVDFNAVDQLGHSILVNAVQGYRSLEFISTLVNRFKVNWGGIDKGGLGALHAAAFIDRSPDYLKFFLELGGLDVNKVNDKGETALFYAVKKRRTKNVLEKCELLIALGADVSIPNKAGITPLSKVESEYEGYDKYKLVELLRPPNT